MPERDAKLDQLLMRSWTSCYGPRSNKPDCCGSVTATKTVIVEPPDYGQHNGVIKLLTWQVGGSSSGPFPNWRWMEIDQISDVRVLGPTPYGKHHKGDKLFLKVKPHDGSPG